MLGQLLRHLLAQNSTYEPEKARTFFILLQLGIAVAILGLILKLTSGKRESGFKLREADRPRDPKKQKISPAKDPLGQAKLSPQDPAKIYLLEGIRTDLPPHELLGVSANATEKEIQKAYLQLIKRYHPDRVGPPGSREWADAQRIAEAINGAKEALLKKRRS